MTQPKHPPHVAQETAEYGVDNQAEDKVAGAAGHTAAHTVDYTALEVVAAGASAEQALRLLVEDALDGPDPQPTDIDALEAELRARIRRQL